MRSTSARRASGVVLLPGLRNTAVPGTRWIGVSPSHSSLRNWSSGPSSAMRLRVRICRAAPPGHHHEGEAARPTTSGSHAPWSTLDRLEEKKAISTVRNSAPSRARRQRGVCHIERDDGQEQDRVEHEGAGHRHAVDVGQLGRVLEADHERHDAEAEHPVDHRDVDLALQVERCARSSAGAGTRAERPGARPRRSR